MHSGAAVWSGGGYTVNETGRTRRGSNPVILASSMWLQASRARHQRQPQRHRWVQQLTQLSHGCHQRATPSSPLLSSLSASLSVGDQTPAGGHVFLLYCKVVSRF